MKLQLLVLVLVFLMAFATARNHGGLSPMEDIMLEGGWNPIEDINDPEVIEIANYAVTEFNKQTGATLKFKKVIKGESQIVSGTNYRLIISTSNSALNVYDAFVYDCPWEHVRNLTTFIPVKHH
ncbi:cysteine proteinase inhibitor 1-like [Trifolium medium]|uniref:Cysteine proteinase inhibitor 1-like n=1 Tax=Trifolium medium TaxID=97028 RepID=A0A392PRS6_9FABA|nr:cysteine proteinase inhibitor 1-like [Trifolium medium]